MKDFDELKIYCDYLRKFDLLYESFLISRLFDPEPVLDFPELAYPHYQMTGGSPSVVHGHGLYYRRYEQGIGFGEPDYWDWDMAEIVFTTPDRANPEHCGCGPISSWTWSGCGESPLYTSSEVKGIGYGGVDFGLIMIERSFSSGRFGSYWYKGLNKYE